MKKILKLLVALIFAMVAVLGFVAAWKVIGFTHFFVQDAVGDAREMRGDGPQPAYWRDFIGYFWFYMPVLALAAVSGLFAAIAGALWMRAIIGQELKK